jgi:hypothetical protein
MKLALIDDEADTVDLDTLIHEFKLASDALEDAKRAKDYWQSRLDEALVAHEHKSETVPYAKDPTKDLRAVRVSNRRYSVDTVGMIKHFGKRNLAKADVLKEPEIDKAKLDKAMSEEGTVFTKDEVMAYIKVTDHPSVRLYLVDRKEDDTDDYPED